LHDDITYLFAKQIEEAELLLLNKCDLLPESGLTFLRNWLLAYLPGVQVLPVSGQTGEGLAAWVERFLDPLTSQSQPHQVLDLDYTRYGRAEARLGWLNASGILGGDGAALAQDWADGVLAAMVTGLAAAALPVAHVKLLLEQATGGQFDQAIKASVTGPAPAIISWDSRDTAFAGIQAMIETQTCFQPAPPQPQYRYPAEPPVVSLEWNERMDIYPS
jgi:hypothetical protein